MEHRQSEKDELELWYVNDYSYIVYEFSFNASYYKGNTWDVEVGFENESKLQYKYFVHVEGTRDIRWEKITNR